VFDAREEVLLMSAFWLAAFAVMQRDDSFMFDTRVWAGVLVVQSVPYLASLLLSLISAMPRLPARLIGPLQEMRAPGTQDRQPSPPCPQPAAETDRVPEPEPRRAQD
jgi:hypothetical protein